MANKQTFTVAVMGLGVDAEVRILDTVLKKFFSPSQFQILVSVTPDWRIEQIRQKVENRQQTYPKQPGLPEFLRKLEVRALCAFSDNEEANCSLAFYWTVPPNLLGRGTPQHLVLQALFLERIGQSSWDPTLLNLIPWYSSLTLPNQDTDTGFTIVFKQLIEGWQKGSLDYDGIMRRLRA